MEEQLPLSGIRVLALASAIAAPACGRYLADYGAEVIKIETRRNPDTMRYNGPRWLSPDKYGIEVWMDCGPGNNEYNSGLRSVGLDLKAPGGLEAVKRLLAQCDVFLSNFSAPAVKRLGLDYDSVRAAKPDIVYAMMSGFGATPGPYYDYLAFGVNQASLVGIDDMTGWPDAAPAGMVTASFTDFTSALHGLVAVLAALAYRDQTGEGQFIDLSQFEGAVALLGPALLAYEASGESCSRAGNRVPWAAPQGVYPCRGNDCWVAICIHSDKEWQALCQVAGHMEWTEASSFCTLSGRLEDRDELDHLIAEWTRQHAASEVAEWLQAAGVAAGPVLSPGDLALDPQLAARNFWILADHPRFGKDLATGDPIRLQATPPRVGRAAPALGQDNQHVLGELCGYSAAEIEELIEKGTVFPMSRPEVRLERPYLGWIRHVMPQLPWPGPGATADSLSEGKD